MKTLVKFFSAIYSDYAKADATKWAYKNGYQVISLTAVQLTGAADGFNDWVAVLGYEPETESTSTFSLVATDYKGETFPVELAQPRNKFAAIAEFDDCIENGYAAKLYERAPGKSLAIFVKSANSAGYDV
jgi:hypothetical protein